MAQIKDDLDACKTKSGGSGIQSTRTFLQHLTETHAKGAGISVNDTTCSLQTIRSTIRLFIAVTHPDKNHDKERHI